MYILCTFNTGLIRKNSNVRHVWFTIYYNFMLVLVHINLYIYLPSSGPSECHQERCFSTKTPPPVPKKKLARTMSLPGEFSGCSYTRPALMPHLNPLTMLSPLDDVFDPGSGEGDGAPEVFLDIPCPLPLPQLGFDTPDEQLPCFFSSLNNLAQVSEKLQQRLLLFLWNTLERMEMGVCVTDACLGKIQPQDLMLCKEDLPLHAQDRVWYHRVRCPRMHGQEFSIKVRKSCLEASLNFCPTLKKCYLWFEFGYTRLKEIRF